MAVLVANEDLTVIGGPTSINVSMDLGATGKRGSQIFISPGKPNEVVIGQEAEVFDLCINTLASDDEYLYMYQFQNLGAVNQWVALFNIIPDTFSANLSKVFVDGEATVNVPVFSITQTESLTAQSFNVQMSIANGSPVASAISISEIEIVDEVQILPITIVASEYVEDAWVPLSGTKIIHLSITVV
jgi:hypothetical protein